MKNVESCTVWLRNLTQMFTLDDYASLFSRQVCLLPDMYTFISSFCISPRKGLNIECFYTLHMKIWYETLRHTCDSKKSILTYTTQR